MSDLHMLKVSLKLGDIVVLTKDMVNNNQILLEKGCAPKSFRMPDGTYCVEIPPNTVHLKKGNKCEIIKIDKKYGYTVKDVDSKNIRDNGGAIILENIGFSYF